MADDKGLRASATDRQISFSAGRLVTPVQQKASRCLQWKFDGKFDPNFSKKGPTVAIAPPDKISVKPAQHRKKGELSAAYLCGAP